MDILINLVFMIAVLVFSTYYNFEVVAQSKYFEGYIVISIIFSFIAVISIYQIIKNIIILKKRQNETNIKIDKDRIILFLLMATYLFLVKFLGYFIASFLFLSITLYWQKTRGVKQLLIFPVCVLILIYLVFVLSLKVRMPAGFFI